MDTVFRHANSADSNGRRRKDEGVIVFLSIDFSSLPRVLLYVYLHLEDVTVGTQKVATKEDGKLFGAGDALLHPGFAF